MCRREGNNCAVISKFFASCETCVIADTVCVFSLGSFESTFSFRIREDRQLMGFSKESTFNQLCGTKDNENNPSSCTPPTYWKMAEGIHGTKKSISSRKQSEL